MTGPRTTMMPGLKNWVWPTFSQLGIWVDWSANRVSEEPACSNRAQNRTEKKISTSATSMRVRSAPFSLMTV